MKKVTLITYIFLFIIIFFCIYSYNRFINLKLERYSEFNLNNNELLSINKIIIIGDSRMELINSKKEIFKIPNNITFIAKSGAKIDWLYYIGISKLNDELVDTSKYKYHVVFNMGVNDLNSNIEVTKLAHKYFTIYSKIIEKYNNVLFYFLSVNPVDEEKIYKYFSKDNKRTNKKIEEFNKYFINKLSKMPINNAKYCDAYKNIDFYLSDGLHYDTKTNKKIMDFIINDCVKINNQINLTS